MLKGGREPQERLPRMCDDLPDGVEEQEAQPLGPGGAKSSGSAQPLEGREEMTREHVQPEPGGVRSEPPC